MRDAILGRSSRDFDFAVGGNAIRFSRHVANKLKGDFYALDEERDAGRVLLRDESGQRSVLDFVSMRGDSIEADLLERDFTINAMAIELSGGEHLYDPCGGSQDLRDQRLKACREDSIASDPIRVLRAIRLANQFDLRIEAKTLQMTKASVPDLATSSAERIRDEFMRMLNLPHLARGLRVLDAIGVLDQIFPELAPLKALKQSSPHRFDVWEHTLKSVENLQKIMGLLDRDYPSDGAQDLASGLIVLKLGRYREQISDILEQSPVEDRPRRSLLLLAVLLHDTGKASTQEIGEDRIRYPGHEALSADIARQRLEALKFSRAEIDSIALILAEHKRITEISHMGEEVQPIEIYRYFRGLGERGIDLGLHALADLMGRFGVELPQPALQRRLDIVRSLFEGYFEHNDELIDPPALLDGHTLITELKLEPGPEIGAMLEAMREAQVQGTIATREDALTLARNSLSQ